MSKKEENKRKTFEHLHNKKPVTRREFLATGLIPFAASLVAPNALNMILGSTAQAAASRCSGGSAAGNLPAFLNVNLAGGSGLSSHAIGLDAGGQLLPSYTRMGLGLPGALNTTKEFGGSVWYAQSSFLAGLRSTATPATVRNTGFVSVCVESRDDSAENPIDISGLVDRVRNGNLLPSLNRNRNMPALNVPKPAVGVRSIADLESSILLSGTLEERLDKTQQAKLVKLIHNLSTSQMQKVQHQTYGDQIQNLLACAGIKNSDLLAKDDLGINPLGEMGVAGVWGIDQNSNPGSRDFVLSSIAYNTIKGNSTLGNITLGGYDYHDGTRQTGEQRDQEAGAVVGRILETAAVLGQKTFITVTTDGSVTSSESEVPGQGAWMTDGGNRGMMYIFAYDPAGRPAMKGHQVGNFTAGQVVNERTTVGGSPELASAAVFANYLSFAGNLPMFEQIVGRGALNPSQLDEVSLILG